MSPEHASPELVRAYLSGALASEADEVWALEAHLEECGACRGRLSVLTRQEVPAVTSLLADVWEGIQPRLTAPVPGRRLRRGRLRTWVTPVMAPWLVAITGVALLATVLDLFGSLSGDLSLVLLLAPVLPMLAVMAAWSSGLDSAFELTASAPRSGLPMVLRRTAATLAVVLPALLVGGWVTGAMAAQWLVPSAAFTVGTLALGGVVGVTRAALALAGLWVAGIVVPTLATSRTAFALQPAALPVWAVLFAIGAGVVLLRRNAFTRLAAHQ